MFIELTRTSDNCKLLVNTSSIYIDQLEEDKAGIFLVGDTGGIAVKETYSQILQLLLDVHRVVNCTKEG
jgi:hypothetical protein